MYVIPFVSGLTTVTFLGMSGILWYNFLKAWKGDPGIVIATPDVQMKTIVQLAEKGAEKGIVIVDITLLQGYCNIHRILCCTSLPVLLSNLNKLRYYC